MAVSSEVAKKHPNLSEEDLQEFQEIFNLVDTDRGGSIGTEELARLMDTLGIRTSPEELKLMVSEIDEPLALAVRSFSLAVTMARAIACCKGFHGDSEGLQMHAVGLTITRDLRITSLASE